MFIIQQKTRILCRLLDADNVEEVLKALQPLFNHPSERVITDLIDVGDEGTPHFSIDAAGDHGTSALVDASVPARAASGDGPAW